jgi:transcriptional accessory protein Tex/SPT6
VAIHVFAENVKKLLLASPFGPKAVLGVDPGIRTGCKIAVVDDSGKYVASTVMHLQTDDQKAKAVEMLHQLFTNGQGFEIRAVAVGNGTAGRETEIFVRKALLEKGHSVPVVMVSESGASVYSASEIAREEFPELDLTIRGAISIARRLQDPLAELVKVDPKSIGVGQYQHDVSPHALKRSLDVVVDSCVNQVGVNLNTVKHHSSHLARVLGADAPAALVPSPPRSEMEAISMRATSVEDVRYLLGGAVVGALAFKRHRVLGAIGTAMVAANAPALTSDAKREIALYNVAQTGAAVGGSLLWKQHPVLGFIAGTLSASLLRMYVIKK